MQRCVASATGASTPGPDPEREDDHASKAPAGSIPGGGSTKQCPIPPERVRGDVQRAERRGDRRRRLRRVGRGGRALWQNHRAQPEVQDPAGVGDEAPAREVAAKDLRDAHHVLGIRHVDHLQLRAVLDMETVAEQDDVGRAVPGGVIVKPGSEVEVTNEGCRGRIGGAVRIPGATPGRVLGRVLWGERRATRSRSRAPRRACSCRSASRRSRPCRTRDRHPGCRRACAQSRR